MEMLRIGPKKKKSRWLAAFKKPSSSLKLRKLETNENVNNVVPPGYGWNVSAI
jgi:hypothetical protein